MKFSMVRYPTYVTQKETITPDEYHSVIEIMEWKPDGLYIEKIEEEVKNK